MIQANQASKFVQAAMDARNASYSPYSKFRVGAAILCDDGEIITGANVENASYGAGICAERTALVKAMTGTSSKRFVALAVSADIDDFCSPCGICRQFIREFCPLDTPIYMSKSTWTAGDDDKLIVKTLEELLPMSFGPDDLTKQR